METLKPDRIMQLIWAYIPQRALTTAVDLGLFTHLAHGAGTAAEVATAAGASERGVRMILDVLVALGLVTKEGGRYGLTPESETFLVVGQPGYLGALAQHTDLLWPTFGQLTEVVRTGRPTRSLENQDDGTEFFEKLVPQIFAMTFPQACAAAAALDVGGAWRGLTVLDLGAGTAAWSIAMLQRDATSRAVAVDYPGVLQVTREFTARYGVADRFEYRSGNLRDVDYGEGTCDLG